MAEYTKEQLKEALRAQLASNPEKAVRGLMEIYGYQTAQEQRMGTTVEHNGVGFSGCDSEILSSFAEQYKSRGWLSNKQLALVTRIMPRYAGQLLEVSFSKGNFAKVGRKWVINR